MIMKTIEDIKKTLKTERNLTQAPKKELDLKLKEKLDNILKKHAQSTASNSLENSSEDSEDSASSLLENLSEDSEDSNKKN